MDALKHWLDQASAVVWGGPTVVLLLAVGAYLSFVLRGIQLRGLVPALRIGLLDRDEPDAEGDISHFQALMLALGGSVGVGNLVGVAAAIAAGGPGALFWLWLAGWLVMATRYAEGVLGVYYREPDRTGRMAGGPMYYLSRGVGGRFGRVLAVVFAVLAVLAALGIGSAVPGHVAADALQASFSVPPLLTALVLAGAAALVLAGGITAIGRAVGVLVPFMVAIYLAGALLVVALNWRRLDDALIQVARGAFTATAAVGGLFGASLREGVHWGMAQGVLSSGAGLGTAGIAAAAARTRTATTQALVAMTQAFLDTVVISAVTGLAVLVSGAHEALTAGVGPAYVGAPVTTTVVRSGLPGDFGGAILAIGLAFFAFSTILAWSYYGERAAEYLLGARATVLFRALFAVAIVVGGAVVQLGYADGSAVLWSLSELASGAMVIPNVIGLLLLSGIVVRETARYRGTR